MLRGRQIINAFIDMFSFSDVIRAHHLLLTILRHADILRSI